MLCLFLCRVLFCFNSFYFTDILYIVILSIFILSIVILYLLYFILLYFICYTLYYLIEQFCIIFYQNITDRTVYHNIVHYHSS